MDTRVAEHREGFQPPASLVGFGRTERGPVVLTYARAEWLTGKADVEDTLIGKPVRAEAVRQLRPRRIRRTVELQVRTDLKQLVQGVMAEGAVAKVSSTASADAVNETM